MLAKIEPSVKEQSLCLCLHLTTLSARARRLCGIVKPICFAVFKLSTRVGKFNKRSGPKTKINPLTREEIQILVVKAREAMPVYYPLFLCAPRTGLREGELIALKGIDVDFKGKFIDVRRSMKGLARPEGFEPPTPRFVERFGVEQAVTTKKTPYGQGFLLSCCCGVFWVVIGTDLVRIFIQNHAGLKSLTSYRSSESENLAK